MKIVICGSITSVDKIKEISESLVLSGHQTEIPFSCQKIIDGELTIEEFNKEREESGGGSKRKIADDVIKRYYQLIKDSDAVLVVNVEKNNITHYIGGNTFLEMGFAHVLGKKIFLLNPVPDMAYTDEIIAMQPKVINENLAMIK